MDVDCSIVGFVRVVYSDVACLVFSTEWSVCGGETAERVFAMSTSDDFVKGSGKACNCDSSHV